MLAAGYGVSGFLLAATGLIGIVSSGGNPISTLWALGILTLGIGSFICAGIVAAAQTTDNS